MNRWLQLCCLSFVLVACGGPDKLKIEESLRSLTDLGTVEYTLRKVLIVDDEQWYSIGHRKLIMSLKADMKAGIDLSKIQVTNKDEKGDKIEIYLPKSKVILLDIPPSEIKEELVKVSTLRGKFSNKDLNFIAQLGEKDILKKVEALGILTRADVEAKKTITSWLSQLGIMKTNISFTNEEPEPVENTLN